MKNFNLKKITFKVKKGSFHALLGPSGSGKSLIIKSLIGAIKSKKKQILINNFNPSSKKAKKNLGFVPEMSTFPKLNVLFLLKMLAKFHNLKNKLINQKIEIFMKKLGIWHFRNLSIDKFSSGMKKKVMLIQGLIHDPEILILDEPEANLDSESRKIIIKYLKEIVVEKGVTVLFSTHLLDEAKDMIDSCTIINQGKLLFTGKIEELKINNNYLLKVENIEKVISFLKEINIQYKYNEKEKFIIFKVNNPLELNKIFWFTSSNSLIIYNFEAIHIDLNHVLKKISEMNNR
jgi:ABC-2 type transport system ATP-binding protein